MDELDGLWTDYVDSRTELAGGEGLSDAKVSGRTRKVGQDDLWKEMKVSRVHANKLRL